MYFSFFSPEKKEKYQKKENPKPMRIFASGKMKNRKLIKVPSVEKKGDRFKTVSQIYFTYGFSRRMESKDNTSPGEFAINSGFAAVSSSTEP